MTGRSTRWILISCLAIAAGIAAIFAFGVPTNTVLLVALALACPLAHLWMMRSGAHDHGEHATTADITWRESTGEPRRSA